MLVLISIPLAFALIVLGVLASVQQRSMSTAAWVDHSNTVLAQSLFLSQTMDIAGGNYRKYLLTGDSRYSEQCRLSLSQAPYLVERLEQLVADNPSQVNAATQLGVAASRRQQSIFTVLDAADGGRKSQSQMTNEQLADAKLLEAFRASLTTFTREERQLQTDRSATLLRLFDLSDRLMTCSAIAAFGLALIVISVLSRGAIRRLVALGSKARRFLAGEPVGPDESPRRDDEIGIADRAFHDVEANAAEREEASLRYRLLAETARDNVLMVRRRDWSILEANDDAAITYGYERAELLKMKITDLRTADDVTELADQVEGSDEATVVFESRHLRRNGKSFPVEIAAQGAIIHGEPLLLCIVRDLSDRKRAEHEREKFFDASADMMCTTDFDGYVTQLNPAWERTLGYPLAEIRAVPFQEFVHPDDREATLSALAALATGINVKPFENRYRRKDGSYLWVSWSALPSLDEGLIYAVARDVTQRRRNDEDLARTRDQAMEATRVKSQFLANMSHEIRTPMNGIIGTAELLGATHLDSEQREYADIIKESGYALLTIVNQILNLSKLEAGKVTVESVDFSPASVVESVATLFAPQARDKGISIQSNISSAIPRMVRGDIGHLRQVLLNIAGNAVKFTERGEVSIRATVASAKAASVVLLFTVQDSGIGFSEKALKRLFEPFTQADATTTRRYGGTGLGLSISKRLVELMDGEIGVESTEGTGSKFWFTARFERSTQELESGPHADLAGLRTLVVDPDSTSRDVLHEYMTSWAMRCGEWASTKGEALAALRRAAQSGDPFRLAIVEAGVAFDGELMRAIAQDPELSNTKLILLNPIGVQPQRDDALTSGFASFLSVPIRQSYLLDCITGALNQGVTSDEAQAGEATEKADPSPAGFTYQAHQRILLAEDSKINQRLAVAQFKKLGIEADLAATGQEAVDAVARRDYSLVLMDCQMPEMDGFAATRAIRTAEALTGGHVPIVAMTANAMDGDRENCISRGMDDYLSKPVELDQLREMLERWIPVSNGQAAGGPEPMKDAIDLARLRDLFSGDESALFELLRATAEQSRSVFGRLREAVVRSDAKSAGAAAHELKGFAGNVGAGRLAELSAQVQSEVDAQRWPDALSGCTALSAEVDRVEIFVADSLPTNGAQGA